MVGWTTLVAAVTTAGVNLAAIGFVAGVEAQPRAEASRVQRTAAPTVRDEPEPKVSERPIASEREPIVKSLGKRNTSFTAQAEPQTLEVTGANFSPGSTATLVAPLGAISTFASASLSDLTPGSFTLAVTLDEPGTYEFSIRSATGLRSNTLPVVVIR